MKKNLLVIFTIISVTAIYLFVQNNDKSAIIETENSGELDYQHDVTGKKVAKKNETLSVSDDKLEHSRHPTLEEVESAKIPYEGDWCIRGVDLSKQDLLFAKQESKDWAEKRSNIWLNRQDFKGDYTNNKNAEMLEPYREMNKDDLLEISYQDDRYAMITAIQRKDISWEIRNKFANRLLILGDTTMSLFQLVTNEVVEVRLAFAKTEKVTPDIKQRLINILSYVSYGISRYDSMPLIQYVSTMRHDKIFGEKLDPNHVLSAQDYEQIKVNVQDIARQIDELRSKENLIPISDIDVPNIANYDFQRSVSILYLEYGQIMDRLQDLNLETGPSLERSNCVKRYVELFG